MAPSTNPFDNIPTLADNVIKALDALAKSKAKGIDKESILHSCHQAARWIPLGLDAFCEPIAIFTDIQELDFESLSAERKSFKEKYLMIFKMIEYLSSSSKDQELDDLLTQMTKWAAGARNEDTHTAKLLAVEILRPDPTNDVIVPPISPKVKECRGFNHPMTARLLCPRKDLELFDSNPMDYMAKVNDNEIQILATDFPSFLYDENIPYDPEYEMSGLFRGYYALRMFRGIFTGSSSAVQKFRISPKRSKAETHGMTEVSPQILAYSCVHARFSLSSTSSWSMYDGTFDMVAFYNMIVSMLEDKEDEDVQEILKYWHSEAPHLNRKVTKVQNIVQDPGICADKIDSILAQRAKRRAAQKAAQQTEPGGPENENEHRGCEGERHGDEGDEDEGLGVERLRGSLSNGSITNSQKRRRCSRPVGSDDEDYAGQADVVNEELKDDDEGIESEDGDGNGYDDRVSSDSMDEIPLPKRKNSGPSKDSDHIPDTTTSTEPLDGTSHEVETTSDTENELPRPLSRLTRAGVSSGESGEKNGDGMSDATSITKKPPPRIAKTKATSLRPPAKKAKKS